MLTRKKIELLNKNVPIHGIPINTANGPAITGVALILALEALDHYNVKTINQIPEETHDAKYPTAHHRG